MANNGNLIPQAHTLTLEEQSRGGKKRQEQIKQRKTLREELLALLEQGDTQKNMTLSVLMKALDGDLKAYEIIRDTIGEKPKEQVEQKQEIKISMENDLGTWGK